MKIRGIKVDCKTGKQEIVEEEISDAEYQKRQQAAKEAREREEQERLIQQEAQKILREQAIASLKAKGIQIKENAKIR